MARRNPLRRAGFDDLGLKRALSDRLLPLLVAAMVFLAAMALAGAVAAASLAEHWRLGAAASLTVQIPQPGEPAAADGGTRREAVLRLLRGTPGVAEAHLLTDAELSDLLRPWLGSAATGVALPLPAVISVRLVDGTVPPDLADRLTQAAPGTLLENQENWMRRLSILARSLQACAGAALVVVGGVAAAVVATATRAGLATRREAIDIIHGLGATDGYIARRFAGRITFLTTLGAILGALAALPVLLALAGLAAPFTQWNSTTPSFGASLPLPIWAALPGLPAGAALIGWVTAQGTVRSWLRRLP